MKATWIAGMRRWLVNIGDLVQVPAEAILEHPDLGPRNSLEYGVVMDDHSPMRPRDVARIVDVLWNDGELEEFWSGDLVVISERG
tara:strand:- start:549 stop:803 length:255 start_codon:yes stop_codon:yes gene_type:complete